jgi:hypothetical protein
MFSLMLNLINAQGEISEDSAIPVASSWDYLSQEWKSILLDNSIVRSVDYFFTSISPVFFVLFSEPYSMSLRLLFIVIFWFFFLIAFYRIFKYYSTFSKLISFGISFLIALIASHLKLAELPATALIWLFFGEKPWWIKLIAGIVILFVLVGIIVLIKKFGKNYKERRAKVKEELNQMKLEGQVKAGEQITDALSKFAQK